MSFDRAPVWINGTLSAPEEAKVSVFDHGIVVGDGVFETVKAIQGRPFALTRHLQRLAVSAAGLALPEPNLDALRQGTHEVLAAAPAWHVSRVRITFTSGLGPLGSDRGTSGPTMIVAVAEQYRIPAAADALIVPWPRSEHGALSGLKTTSYGDNAKALAYAHQCGASEAIFVNLAGNLCEGTGSNVFLVHDNRLITPPVSSGCLARHHARTRTRMARRRRKRHLTRRVHRRRRGVPHLLDPRHTADPHH